MTLSVDALKDVGAATPEAAIETYLWAGLNARRERIAKLLDFATFKDELFVKIRQENPTASVADADRLATELVGRMKGPEGLGNYPALMGDFTNAVSIAFAPTADTGDGSGVVVLKVTYSRRDGTSHTDTVQLRKLDGSYVITPTANQVFLRSTPVSPATGQPGGSADQTAGGTAPPPR